MKSHRMLGFTLVELMIVVVIIGILLGLGYPSYARHRLKVYRNDGKQCLLNAHHRLEGFFARFNRYPATLAELGVPEACGTEGRYTLALVVSAGSSSGVSACGSGGSCYSLEARPGPDQAKDGLLTIQYDAGMKEMKFRMIRLRYIPGVSAPEEW